MFYFLLSFTKICYDEAMPEVKKFPALIALLLILFIGIANGFAEYYHLYFFIWWFDIPMHIVGGVWVALTILLYYYALPKEEHQSTPRFAFLLALCGTLVVALGWEIFEFGVDRANHVMRFNELDTIKDIADGLLGATLGTTFFVWKGYNKST
jgi:hypothetical protein